MLKLRLFVVGLLLTGIQGIVAMNSPKAGIPLSWDVSACNSSVGTSRSLMLLPGYVCVTSRPSSASSSSQCVQAKNQPIDLNAAAVIAYRLEQIRISRDREWLRLLQESKKNKTEK